MDNRRRFTLDVHIELDELTSAHHNLLQLLTVDARFHCFKKYMVEGREKRSAAVPPQNLVKSKKLTEASLGYMLSGGL